MHADDWTVEIVIVASNGTEKNSFEFKKFMTTISTKALF